jgi:2'-5' RNA ligase
MFEYLVLLEIRDDEIASLIHALRRVFTGKSSRTPVHVTLRGPYSSPIDSKRLAKWMNEIQDDVLLISGAARFETHDEHVVFLKVSATNNTDNLNRITRKHDFPKSRYGFNPHITIYSGPDKLAADAAYRFLLQERLEVLCRDFELGVHAISPQYDLFPIAMNRSAGSYGGLVSKGVIRDGIVERAQSALQARNLESRHDRNPKRTQLRTPKRTIARRPLRESKVGALSIKPKRQNRRSGSR